MSDIIYYKNGEETFRISPPTAGTKCPETKLEVKKMTSNKEIELVKQEIKMLQSKLEFLEEIERHNAKPKMHLENGGEFSLVSYNNIEEIVSDIPDISVVENRMNTIKDPIIFTPEKEIKNKFLSFIETDKNINAQNSDTISKTSYFSNSYDFNLVNLYYKTLHEYVKKHISKHTMNCIWYQIYDANSGSYHDYHTHNAKDCQISGIYYLKLINKSISTEFIIGNSKKQFDVREGDILLFDASLMHRSPPNNTPEDKIILSFNLHCHPI